jgi:hypothetical protein
MLNTNVVDTWFIYILLKLLKVNFDLLFLIRN